MNKEMLLEVLKDATNNLGKAAELIGELPTKDKVNAHIEMAKAYALTSIAVALAGDSEQAPETAAETKKTKTKSKDKAVEPEKAVTSVPQEAEKESVVEEVAAPVEVPKVQDQAQEEAPAVVPQEEAQSEEPLIKIVNDVFIQFTKPVIEEDFDYSTWFMTYVNAVDEAGNSVVGVEWANQYVAAFSHGKNLTVEDLNEDNVLAFMKFIIDSINAMNQSK